MAAAAATAMLPLTTLPGVEDLEMESVTAGATVAGILGRFIAVEFSKSKSLAEAADVDPPPPLIGTLEEDFPACIPPADVSSEELEDPPRQSEELPEEPLSLPGPP